MRLVLIRTLILLAVIGIVWLLAGRSLVMLLDRFVTSQMTNLSDAPVVDTGSELACGEKALAFYPAKDSLPKAELRHVANRVVLASEGRTFELGTVGRPLAVGPFTGKQVVADPGDTVACTLERSVASWPTPFEMNFMTGRSPRYKRNLYYRLVWKKASGQRLEMLWRFEQWYYPTDGWSSVGGMTREGATGLVRVDIGGAAR